MGLVGVGTSLNQNEGVEDGVGTSLVGATGALVEACESLLWDGSLGAASLDGTVSRLAGSLVVPSLAASLVMSLATSLTVSLGTSLATSLVTSLMTSLAISLAISLTASFGVSLTTSTTDESFTGVFGERDESSGMERYEIPTPAGDKSWNTGPDSPGMFDPEVSGRGDEVVADDWGDASTRTSYTAELSRLPSISAVHFSANR